MCWMHVLNIYVLIRTGGVVIQGTEAWTRFSLHGKHHKKVACDRWICYDDVSFQWTLQLTAVRKVVSTVLSIKFT